MKPAQAKGPSRLKENEPRELDLKEICPGLFQIVTVRAENQDRAFVSKPVPVVSEFARLCNSVLDGSFDVTTRQVDFVGLNESRVQPVGIFGYNNDVWNSLQQLGIPKGLARDALQEGLIVWCPWLRTDKPSEGTEEMSDDGYDVLDVADVAVGAENACLYVCAWAGADVEAVRTHAPFILQLRLLVELCDGIILTVSDASSFNPERKPFQSGEGITLDFSVREQMSSRTGVQVGQSVTELAVNSKSGWPVRNDRKGPMCGLWQRMPGGASLLAMFDISSTYTREDMFIFSGHSDVRAAAIRSQQMQLSPELRTQMEKSVTLLVSKVSECLRPGRYQRMNEARQGILAHPAVELGRLLCNDSISLNVSAMDTLMHRDFKELVHDSDRKSSTPEVSDEELFGTICTAQRSLIMKWFNVELLSDEDWMKQTTDCAVPEFPDLPAYQGLVQMEKDLQGHFEQQCKRESVVQEFAMILSYHEFCKQRGLMDNVHNNVMTAALIGLRPFFHKQAPDRAHARMAETARVCDAMHFMNDDGTPKKKLVSFLTKKKPATLPRAEELIACVAYRLQPDLQEGSCDREPSVFESLYDYICSCLKLQNALPLEDMWQHACEPVRKKLMGVIPCGVEWPASSTMECPEAAFACDAQDSGFHMRAMLEEVAVAAIFGQHLTDQLLEMADPVTVAKEGAQVALDSLHKSSLVAATHAKPTTGTSSSWGSYIPGYQLLASAGSFVKGVIPLGKSDTVSDEALAAPTHTEILAESRKHAQLLLRRHRDDVLRWIKSDTGSMVVQATFKRLADAFVGAGSSQFLRVRKVLQERKMQDMNADLVERVADFQASLKENLSAVINCVDKYCLQSCASHHGPMWTLTKCAGVPAGTKVEYKYYETVDTHGSWVADVLHKSSKGEAGEVSLGCEIVADDLKTQYLTLLNTKASATNRSTVTVRVDARAHHPTTAFVHPPGTSPGQQHRVMRYPKAALAARYEPTTRILALLVPCATQAHRRMDGQAVGLNAVFFAFSADFKKLQQQGNEIKVGWPASAPLDSPSCRPEPPFLLLPSAKSVDGSGASSKLALIMSDDAVRLYNILSKCEEGDVLRTETSGKQWVVTPCRTALLALRRSLIGWVVDAYALEEAGTAQPLFTQILDGEQLPPEMAGLPAQGAHFTVAGMDKHTYLLAAHQETIIAVELQLQSINVQNVLTSDNAPLALADELPMGNKLLNYVHSCCVRFPVDDSLSLKLAEDARLRGERQQCRVVRLMLVNHDEAVAKSMAVYVTQLLDHGINTNAKKPAGMVLQLECMFSTSPAIAVQKGSSVKLGGWVRNAMCLVPLQLSRCSGSALEPMHDGEQRRDFVEDDDIISMSKRLQLGLYEGILGAHNGPTKFVCALGQQSVGKSYHLNHMGGVFFDVAGGRCTDGVWMSARFVPNADGTETLVVFLDCEGIGSPEREEAEDMLHCLLVGSVSSLTIFKTHYAFTTELVQTLQRLNKGAQKVEDIGGKTVTHGGANGGKHESQSLIFRGSIMFCLKDSPADRNEKQGIITAFLGRLEKMVRATDNFVSAIYGNKVAVSAFPGISSEFYSTLKKDCIERLQSQACPAYASGPQALYVLKLMLIKMAHKDWTAIDRQWIVSQALQIRHCMHAVTHFGCEGSVTQAGAVEGSMRLDSSADPDSQATLMFTVELPADVVHNTRKSLVTCPWLHKINAGPILGPVISLQQSLACTETWHPDGSAFMPGAGGVSGMSEMPCASHTAPTTMVDPRQLVGDEANTDSLSDGLEAQTDVEASCTGSSKADAMSECDEHVMNGSCDLGGDGAGAISLTDAEGGTGREVGQLQFSVDLRDQELRMGFLLLTEEDGHTTMEVSRVAVVEDCEQLRRMLISGLGLDNPRQDPDQFRLVHSVLSGFIKAILRRRARAAREWLATGAASFKDSPEAAELQNTLDAYIRRLEAAWQPCTSVCEQCHLPCELLGVHDGHSCGTDHTCHALCYFCVGEGQEDAHVCSGKAGHSGKHMCEARPHVCGKDCALHGRAANCNRVCKKMPGHIGECDCESGNHLCGAECLLPGCGNRCIAPWGADHDQHYCGVSSCPEKCPLCGQGCPEGHFHALEDPGSHHLCGMEHLCQYKDGDTWAQNCCEHPGACVIEGDIEVVKHTFHGKRAEFEYDYITKQDMKRKVCTRKIPPGQLGHEGPHSCGWPAEKHFCGEPCPQCLYRCNKPVNHGGRHKSPHGNLGNKEFKASQDQFALKEREYATGDSGAAETCDSFCHRMGRGHIHTTHCNHTICASAAHDGVRHHTDGNLNAGADGSLQVDEMTHDFFWEYNNFEDPVKEWKEQEEFRKCGNWCNSEEHVDEENGTVERVHCLLDMWHQPLNPRLDSPADHKPNEVDHAFISEDGCLFPCRHITAADVHTLLVIDRSGSMGSSSITPDNWVIRSHPYQNENVLGVVYEAAYKYMMDRGARAPHDIVSFLPFNDGTTVSFLAQPLNDIPPLLDAMMATHAGGSTDFRQALQTMYQTVNQWRTSGVQYHRPVVILLTDSGDWYKETSTSVLANIMQQEDQYPESERLVVHVIGFGPAVDERFIKELADLGNGSHMTCQAAEDMDRANLVKSFARIAAQPALKVSLLD